MAPLPVITDTFRVVLHWKNAAILKTPVNVMHFFAPTKTASDVYTALNANVTASMWQTIATASSIFEVDVTPLDGSSITTINATGSPSKWSGTVAASDTINQVCTLMKLQTSNRGRSYRGRIYLPWMVEGVTGGGTITAGTVTAMTTAWQTFQAAMGAAGVNLCVASYKLALATEVSVVSCESNTATQRRRDNR